MLTTLKTAMLAPMASARMSMATVVKPGSRPRVRSVYFRSWRKNVEIHKATCLPLLFSCLLNAAECEDGAAASLFWRHAALDVVFDGEVDVGSQLGIEFFIKAFSGEEGAHAAERSFEPGTHRNSVLRRLS